MRGNELLASRPLHGSRSSDRWKLSPFTTSQRSDSSGPSEFDLVQDGWWSFALAGIAGGDDENQS
jgi:uncharacterized GH25 family protein